MLFGASAVRQWFTTAAERPAKFGRYTGRTLYPGVRDGERDQKRLKTLEYYLRIEDDARGGKREGKALVEHLEAEGPLAGQARQRRSAPSTAFAVVRQLRGSIGKTRMASRCAPLSVLRMPNC